MILSPKDKEVIAAFCDTERDPAWTAKSSKHLSTDGKRLDGNWMGGRGIAVWKNNDGIEFGDLGSRSAQTVQRAVMRVVPRSWLEKYNPWLFKKNPTGASTIAKSKKGTSAKSVKKAAPKKWGTKANKPYIAVSWAGIAHQCSTLESAKRQAGARGKILNNGKAIKA